MMTSNRFMAGLVAAGAIALLTIAPAAAQKAPAAPAKPAAKAAPAVKKAATKKVRSECAGLAKSACSANKSCGWIEPKKAKDTRGRTLKAYCRKVAGIAKKK